MPTLKGGHLMGGYFMTNMDALLGTPYNSIHIGQRSMIASPFS